MNNQKERNTVVVNAVTIGEAINAYNKNQKMNKLPTNFGDFEEVPSKSPRLNREVIGKSDDGKYTFAINTMSSYVNDYYRTSAFNLEPLEPDFRDIRYSMMPNFNRADDYEVLCRDIFVNVFKNDCSKSLLYSIRFPVNGFERTGNRTTVYRRDTITINFKKLTIMEQVFVKRSIDIIENIINAHLQKACIVNDINQQEKTKTDIISKTTFSESEYATESPLLSEYNNDSFENLAKSYHDKTLNEIRRRREDKDDEHECDCDGNCANCHHNDYDDDEEDDIKNDKNVPSNDNDYDIKMDGNYYEFEGGAIRYTKDGKGRFDLITSNTASVIARKLIDYANEELEWVICKSSIIKDVYDDIDWFQNIGKLSTQASLYTNLVDAIIKLMIMHYEQHDVDLYATPHKFENNRSDDVLALNSLLNDLAHHYEKGAKKYGERNCEKGIPLSSFIDSGRRHMYQYFAGMKDENHFIATIWNFWMAAHTILATPIDYSRNTADVNNKSESNESDDAFIRLLLNLISKRNNNESDDESTDEDE